MKLFRMMSNRTRGTKTERKLVSKILKARYPVQTIFHDLYLSKGKNRYSQIDVVLATKAGLVVFEVKEYSGWIFGTGFQPKWTQVLNYGKEKYRLYNPILQNKRHIRALRKQLGDATFPIFSVVVFYGDCVFKDIEFLPYGSFLVKSERRLDVLKRIIKDNAPAPCTPQNKKKIGQVLKEGVRNGESREVREGHELRICCGGRGFWGEERQV